MNEIEMEIEDLDTDWITKFDEIDQQYKDFYPEPIQHLPMNYIYINKNNEICKIKQETILLPKPGIISNTHLLDCIKHHQHILDTKYRVLDIIKINLSFTHSSLKYFLKTNSNPNTNLLPSSFIQSIPILLPDNIVFEPSIPLVHDLNCLYILFSEYIYANSNKNKTKTKRKICIPFHNKTKKSI